MLSDYTYITTFAEAPSGMQPKDIPIISIVPIHFSKPDIHNEVHRRSPLFLIHSSMSCFTANPGGSFSQDECASEEGQTLWHLDNGMQGG